MKSYLYWAGLLWPRYYWVVIIIITDSK